MTRIRFSADAFSLRLRSFPPDKLLEEAATESVGQKKVEAISENNAASNHSSGCLAGVKRIKEQTEKGNEAQEVVPVMCDGAFGLVQSQRWKLRVLTWKICRNFHVVGPESQSGDTNILDHEASVALGDSPREAFDFMGTLDRNCNSSSINSGSRFDSSADLDLSLRRCHRDAFENHLTQEKPILWHPNSSAFTRYSSWPSQPLNSTLMCASDQKKESGTNSEKILSNTVYNTDTPGPAPTSQRNMNRSTTGTTDQLKQTEVAESCTQRIVYPVPTSSSLVPSPSSANQQEPACRVNPFLHPSFETNQSTNQPSHKPDQRLGTAEDRGRISPIADQSASATGSFCNGSLNQLDNIAYRSNPASNGNLEQIAVVQASTESKNDDGFPIRSDTRAERNLQSSVRGLKASSFVNRRPISHASRSSFWQFI
ncbi:Detected protein of confused Function [Hibiscus syriacus]|uniref:Detected protein of confused Function n=1 Tax=Hibiscus syriacus TaxID=106335 RepID=A0A6A3CEH1_HIBSY|nr:Detected protein of confused Function [Hibiscus syriacus]